MYTVIDLFNNHRGSLVECYRYIPEYNSLLDYGICRLDGDLVYIKPFPYQ